MILEQIWALFALFLMIVLSVIGWRTSPRGFLYTFIGFLLIFSLKIGNPVGLLVSGGGWMILDLMLTASVMVAFGVAYIIKKRSTDTVERSGR